MGNSPRHHRISATALAAGVVEIAGHSLEVALRSRFRRGRVEGCAAVVAACVEVDRGLHGLFFHGVVAPEEELLFPEAPPAGVETVGADALTGLGLEVAEEFAAVGEGDERREKTDVAAVQLDVRVGRPLGG